MSRKILVAGAGQAAIAFAVKLRELDKDCEITLIGEEPALPYQRPPLSKKYMTGEIDAERLLLRPAAWYDEAQVNCRTSERVVAISPGNRTASLANGEVLDFDKLLFATGAAPRQLPEESGGNLDGVYTLRNLADADAISSELLSGRKLLILGGGYIGLETAAVAVSRGLKVTVVEMANRILNRVASIETADYFRNLHQSNGVEILEGTAITRLTGTQGRVSGAEFPDGRIMPVDFVLVGIGVIPNDTLASAAGLKVSNGIAVDLDTRTSNRDIHAAGDCASFEFRGSRIRLESVQNAIEQAEAAARSIAGETIEYRPVPWFWSDQYDCKLQIAGFNMGFDRTVFRPGQREGSQSIWYFAADQLIAVDAMNDSRSYMLGKRLLELRRNLTGEQAADPDFDIKSLIR
jgi:3-phenylpropionate/trans-cinnamate dioxygenase ferredoxin reductase component